MKVFRKVLVFILVGVLLSVSFPMQSFAGGEKVVAIDIYWYGSEPTPITIYGLQMGSLGYYEIRNTSVVMPNSVTRNGYPLDPTLNPSWYSTYRTSYEGNGVWHTVLYSHFIENYAHEEANDAFISVSRTTIDNLWYCDKWNWNNLLYQPGEYFDSSVYDINGYSHASFILTSSASHSNSIKIDRTLTDGAPSIDTIYDIYREYTFDSNNYRLVSTVTLPSIANSVTINDFYNGNYAVVQRTLPNHYSDNATENFKNVSKAGKGVVLSGGTAGNVSFANSYSSSVSVSSLNGGTITPDKTSALVGETVNLTVTPSYDWLLKGGTLKYTDGSGDHAITGTSFTMPASNVTVSAQFEARQHTVSITLLTGGSVSADKATAAYGNTVNLTVTPDSGKRLKAGTLKYSDGTDHAIAGTSFIMPAANVIVSAEFEDIPDADKIAADKAALTWDIIKEENTSQAGVVSNLRLTTTGAVYGSAITWGSINTAVISNTGVVTRPAYANGDANVTVTATVSRNSSSDTKDFSLKVLKLPQITYTVTFKDWDGSILKTETVNNGAAATAPTDPGRARYKFTGWDKAFNDITSDLTVTAQYSANKSGNRNGGEEPAKNPAPAPKTSGETTTATTETTAITGDNGTATAAVTKDQISEAVNRAAAEAKRQGGGNAAVVEIRVAAPANSSSVETDIPKAAVGLAANGGANALRISTPVASITFDTDALDHIYGEASGDVKITASKIDTALLTDEAKQMVGERPVFNFNVTSGNDTISEFRGNVTVSVPYTPKAGEDPDAIVIYYINAEGKPEAVSNCKYDPLTSTVTFTTNHFSQYAVGYNMVSFNDVKGGAWYERAVRFAAARGIVTGIGNGNYSPDGRLTRGQLLVMLMRAYGIEPDTDLSDNFYDAGNTFYTGYLAAAKRLGITEGQGNNLYAPEKQITRQEMFTLLYNTLNMIGQLPEGIGMESGALTEYSDADSVASWAKDAADSLVDADVIGGSNGKLSPKNTTTRAEMAQVLYNLLSK